MTHNSNAFITPCGTYRYWLSRAWEADGNASATFVMLNPSTADHKRDDPTIRRCIGFAKSWGMSSLHVVNLFALRATDPDELRRHGDPVGPDNLRYILEGCRHAAYVVAAWGQSLPPGDQADAVADAIRAAGFSLHCLGQTRSGRPRHPLYLPAAAALVPFPGGDS